MSVLWVKKMLDYEQFSDDYQEAYYNLNKETK